MYTNINSLRYKISDLEWQLGQTGGDIIALSETHLGPEINDGELNIQGFKIFRKDRNVQGVEWLFMLGIIFMLRCIV